jgi:hypothetical protein
MSSTSGPRCNDWVPWELLGRIWVVTFCDRIYWALSTHAETPSLALQTNREDSRGGTVAEADEVCQEPFPETLVAVFGVSSGKSSASMVTRWGRGRSNGKLRLDGALPLIADFS